MLRPLGLLTLALVVATMIAVPVVFALWPRPAIVQSAASTPTPPSAATPLAQSVAPTSAPPTRQPTTTTSAIAATNVEAPAAPRNIDARIVEGSVSDPASWGYDPRELTVRVGDTITWTNTGTLPHTITAENGAFDSDVVAKGEQWSFTPTTAGTFSYVCALHPTMTGVLVVEAGSQPPATPALTATETVPPTPSPVEASAPTATSAPQVPSASSNPTSQGGRPISVQVVSNGFEPSTVNAAVGDTITWANTDRRRHTVTASDGTFDSGTLDSGARWSFTPTRAGTFAYICAFHPEMQGVLVVVASADSVVEAPTTPAAPVVGGSGSSPSPAAPTVGDSGSAPTSATPAKVEIDLVGTGSFARASGHARFESDRGRRKLRVEVEDVAIGTTLDVFVGGDKVGSMTIASTGEAELELDSKEGPGPVPTTVAGQRVEVRTVDGAVVATGQFP